MLFGLLMAPSFGNYLMDVCLILAALIFFVSSVIRHRTISDSAIRNAFLASLLYPVLGAVCAKAGIGAGISVILTVVDLGYEIFFLCRAVMAARKNSGDIFLVFPFYAFGSLVGMLAANAIVDLKGFITLLLFCGGCALLIHMFPQLINLVPAADDETDADIAYMEDINYYAHLGKENHYEYDPVLGCVTDDHGNQFESKDGRTWRDRTHHHDLNPYEAEESGLLSFGMRHCFGGVWTPGTGEYHNGQ